MSAASKKKSLRLHYPDQPWRWKPEWATGTIKGGSKQEAMVAAGLGFVFLGLSAPAMLAIPEELEKGNHAILAVLLFGVLGVGILGWAIKRARQFWRFGTLRFSPEPMPGSWGGYVGGVISIPKGARLLGDVKLTLRNQNVTTSGSGKNRRKNETILWETGKILRLEKVGGGGEVFELPVLFHAPKSRGQPTDEDEPSSRVVWLLLVEMKVAGLTSPLTARFEIPVFDCGEDLPAPKDGLLESEKVLPIEHYMRVSGVEESREGDDRVWRFYQPRARKSAVSFLLFGVIFGGIGVWVPMLLLKVAFLGVAILMGALLPGIVWHRSELRVTTNQVEVRRQTWKGPRNLVVRRDEVGDLNLAQSMRSGRERYFRLELIGSLGVDPTSPHPLEHFKARKARHLWRRETKGGRMAGDMTKELLRKTPQFEIRVADYLADTQATERVRDYLLEQLTN